MLRAVHRQAVAAPPLTAATRGCAAPRTGLPGQHPRTRCPRFSPSLERNQRRARADLTPAGRGTPSAARQRLRPVPPGAARPRRSVLRTRIGGIRTALIAGVLALIVPVIFIAQHAQAVKHSFLGAQVRLSPGSPCCWPPSPGPATLGRPPAGTPPAPHRTASS